MKDSGIWKKVVTSTSAVNQKIITLIGYDYNVFLLSNYCKQHELQSFSKMTPSKKLSFIDKVSGIEDSKDLLLFLDNKRKELKKEIEATEKLKPELPVLTFSIDRDFDAEIKYLEGEKDLMTQEAIKLLQLESDLKVDEFTLQQLSTKRESFTFKIFVTFNSLEDLLLAHQEFSTLAQQANELKAKKSSIERQYYLYDLSKPLPTIEDLCTYIQDSEYNEKVLEKLKLQNKGTIVCPSCDNEFYHSHNDLQLYDHIGVHTKPIKLSITQPTLLLEYLTNSKDVFDSLNVQIKEISEALDNPRYDLFKSFSVFTEESLTRDFNEYLKSLLNYDKVKSRIDTLKEQLDVFKNKDTFKINTELSNQISSVYSDKATFEYFKQVKELVDKTEKSLIFNKKLLNDITSLITKVKEFSNAVKEESLPLINYHASVLLNDMTESILTKLEIKPNYDIFVNNKNINICSGSEQDTASLAFRLSLGNSIILGMLPLFLGDEIDSASRMERSLLITNVLQNLSDKGYQVILITHKDTTNFENCNIINLSSV